MIAFASCTSSALFAMSIGIGPSSAMPPRGAIDGRERLVLAEIALVGPLDSLVLDLGRAGKTHIEGSMASGETRTLCVPVSARDRGDPAIVSTAREAAAGKSSGSARFSRWSDAAESAFDGVSRGLRSRPRPVVADSAGGASIAVVALLAAAFSIAVTLRRRAILAPSFALIASGAIGGWIVYRGLDARPGVVVYEGDGEAWLRVEAAREEIEIPRLICGEPRVDRIECDPEDAALDWHVTLEERDRWKARAPGARLFHTASFSPGTRRLDARSNEWGTLAETWVREEGAWTGRGVWAFGASLPESLFPVDPPAWLATGLPQGPRILLARFERDESGRPTYVRLVDF